jgi:hypothetical protein
MVTTAGFSRRTTAQWALAVGLLFGGCLVCAGQSGTTLYRWVDADGVVHYSDQPHDGAEKIKVAKPQSYSAPPVPRAQPLPSARGAGVPASATQYTRVEFLSPASDAVYTNTDGRVDYAVAVEPALGPGHQIWILLDGQRVDGAGPAATAGSLTGLDRGSHTLTVEIVDGVGNILANGETVNFNVIQTRVKQQPQPR